MRKVFINQIERIGKLAKKVGEESPNKMSVFLYYEPKAPKRIKRKGKIEKLVDC